MGNYIKFFVNSYQYFLYKTQTNTKMKKVLKILLVFTLFPLTSREQVYSPFPDSNAIWNEVMTNMQPFSIDNYQYGISGDTIINSTSYKKIYLLNDTIFPLELGQYCAAIREDSNKIIYITDCQCCSEPISDEEEVILYDFSKNVGDTVFVGVDGYGPLGYYIIENIDSILIDDTFRKTFHFVDGDYLEYWIEGIGSTRVLFSPVTPETTGSLKWELICFNQDGVVKYLNPAYSNCFPILTAINEESIKSIQLHLNPNPVTGTSILDLSKTNQVFINMSVYNMLGVKMNQIDLIHQSKVEISINEYPPGAYFYLLQSKNNQTISNKFIVIN